MPTHLSPSPRAHTCRLAPRPHPPGTPSPPPAQPPPSGPPPPRAAPPRPALGPAGPPPLALTGAAPAGLRRPAPALRPGATRRQPPAPGPPLLGWSGPTAAAAASRHVGRPPGAGGGRERRGPRAFQPGLRPPPPRRPRARGDPDQRAAPSWAAPRPQFPPACREDNGARLGAVRRVR